MPIRDRFVTFYELKGKIYRKMFASQKLSYLNDMYFVDITNPQDEFYCVMILLALDSASMTKGEETKRAIKKKRIL